MHTPLIYIYIPLAVIVFIIRMRKQIAPALSSFLCGQRRPTCSSSLNNTSNDQILNDQILVDARNPAQLPHLLTQRITEQQQNQLPWTSNLNIADWGILRSLGLKPLGLVMGCSHIQLGYSIKQSIIQKNIGLSYMSIPSASSTRNDISQIMKDNVAYGRQATLDAIKTNYIDCYSGGQMSSEVSDYAHVVRETYHLALARLSEEARLHGAHAVVNIKLSPIYPHINCHQIECKASGTAVKLADSPLPKDPLLCTTSLIEYAKLMQAGSTPVGIAIGLGIYHNIDSYRTMNKNSVFTGNTEITQYSQATYQAKKIAYKHLEQDIAHYGGTGVLGFETTIKVEEIESERNDSKYTDHLIVYQCLGTVITDSKHTALPTIKTALNLNQ